MQSSTIFSCIRLYYIHEMQTSTDPDVNYSLTTVYSAIEVNLAIWAASIPALWPLIRGRMHTTRSGETGYTGDQGQGYHRRSSNQMQTNERNIEGRSHQGFPDDDTEDLVVGSRPKNSDEIILTRITKRGNYSSTEVSPDSPDNLWDGKQFGTSSSQDKGWEHRDS